MSLGIVIKGPEGLVLAAESRITLSTKTANGTLITANFDNATKLLSFNSPNCAVGVVTYGAATIGLRSAQSFIPEFEAELSNERMSIKDFTENLSEFFSRQWKEGMPDNYPGPDMTFVVGGFDENDPYGKVFLINIPHNPEPVQQHIDGKSFGITWGGQREFVDRLLLGQDQRLKTYLESKGLVTDELKNLFESIKMQIPLEAMALQDCVNLAIFFVRTAISAQELSVGVRGCGGAIDVATITRKDGLKFVQRKEIVGEDRKIGG